MWICICVSHCICFLRVGTNLHLCFLLYLEDVRVGRDLNMCSLWIVFYRIVSMFLIVLVMNGSVWICICVLHCICYEWVGTDLRGGWLLVAVPRWFPSCHTEAAPTQTHTDPKLTKAQNCFRSVLVSIQCVIYWASSCQPRSYVRAWSLGER